MTPLQIINICSKLIYTRQLIIYLIVNNVIYLRQNQKIFYNEHNNHIYYYLFIEINLI